MKYATSKDILNKGSMYAITPWKKRGLQIYESLEKIPDNCILISSHFAPWCQPLKDYIKENRPYIEIEYGYWGLDNPRRETRRVTFNNHHNLQIRTVPFSRKHLFQNPKILPWQQKRGNYILGILPIPEVLKHRTGETIDDFKTRIELILKEHYSGPIVWRKKYGPKKSRFESFKEQALNAYAVVGERTMACVESCLLGVPAFTIDVSMTSVLMGDITNLNNSVFPDRNAWFEHICWSQFHFNEFESDTPAELVEQYQINGYKI